MTEIAFSPTPVMKGLTEGRIVHFVLPDGQHRPAIVVRVWNQDNGCANLLVFTDGTNDRDFNRAEWYLNTKPIVVGAVVWATSIIHSEEPKPGTWHWIEKA